MLAKAWILLVRPPRERPIALFGPAGYGLRTGLLAAPARLLQGGAPLLFALVPGHVGTARGAPAVRHLCGAIPVRVAGSRNSALTDEELHAMEGPWFDIAPQGTFDTEHIRVGAPLLSRREPRHGLSMRFSHGKVTPSHNAPPAAETALRRFKEALAELYVDVPIGPGDICLIHNRQVIHGRGAPGSGVGGTTRWLLRTYGWMDATVGHPQRDGPSHCHL